MGFYSNEVNMGSVSMVTATLGVNDPAIGAVRIYNNERYRFVYNGGVYQALPYRPVIASATAWYITNTLTTEAGQIVGVVKHATITTNAYGWILTNGHTDVLNGMAGTAFAAQGAAVCGASGICAYTATYTLIPNITVISAGASGGTGASLTYCFVNTNY